MQQLPKQPNRSVLEGIEVLLAVSRSGGAVRVRELARELGMTPTRLQRYLATLAYGGLLRRREDRKYEAGPGMHALSAISLTASGLAGRALRLLPPLSESGCIVALGVVWRQSVSYLYFHVPGMAVMHSLG
ncbi:MAG: helix-turn-helix domain-containing protein [Verrucomicrobia bacterium]|nr:helix-turn-helix domain-containing protein [Verrucomicrobiota bacterium]